MTAFIYTDNEFNVFNWKLKIWPIRKLLGIFFADSITQADEAFEKKFGNNPANKISIGCAPVKLEELGTVMADRINPDNLAINSLKKTITDKDFEIYGLENPWLKPQPDYSI